MAGVTGGCLDREVALGLGRELFWYRACAVRQYTWSVLRAEYIQRVFPVILNGGRGGSIIKTSRSSLATMFEDNLGSARPCLKIV